MKSLTNIKGVDGITGGGLPTGRTTLVAGDAGSGKTVFALQMLVEGAQTCTEPGIFVAFEESAQRIKSNARTFGWDLDSLERENLFFLDAQPDIGLLHSGEFDIEGMLAALEVRVSAMGAKRIVFDAIDIILVLMPDTGSVRREVFRLHNWLLKHELTAVITMKSVRNSFVIPGLQPLDFMQFMVDCSIQLNHTIQEGVSQRSLRVCKYRGSAFEENEVPYIIGTSGIEVAFTSNWNYPEIPASDERLSTGVDRLDEMLEGGYFRCSSVLLTGSPGTAKTTLSGAFAAAACERGENVLFISFDSRSDEIVRNLDSVSVRLEPHIQSGRLRMLSLRALTSSAETHLLRIRELAVEHAATCLVIDPLSALAKSGNISRAPSVAERMIDWAKAAGMTVMCTSLLHEGAESKETNPLQISAIADSWLHLSYVVHAGERNRALSIVKSRGTGHSNQVRELLLSSDGIDLNEVYTADGEVLMGSMRWAREREAKLARREREAHAAQEQARLQAETSDLEHQIALLQDRLVFRREEENAVHERYEEVDEEKSRTTEQLHRLRKDRETWKEGGGGDEQQ
ncbi:circadian clock protein KaiC [Fodinicurvata fenggangensis]|uniref:circadian clock protein KaiC n=1 Tax=Fodinicurvata fenggangensis TaxID=1121830 RepID=UPI0006896D4A|nr:circadian clock protein KaiC [Fodinicurvata fenggangensis]